MTVETGWCFRVLRVPLRVMAAAALVLFGVAGVASPARASAALPATCGRATLLAANPAAHLPGPTPVPHLDGTYTPVLLVHGWNGSPDMWWHEIDHSVLPWQPSPTGSLADKLQRIRGAAVYTLDYHDVAGQWFTHSGAGGPLFLSAVRCLLASPAFTGQKLVVVAHSMGGLIARWAVNTDAQIRARTGLVVTFGTPYDGSWLSEVGVLVTAGAAVVTITNRTLAYLVSLVHLLKVHCDASPSAPGCPELEFLLSEADSGLGFAPIGGHMGPLADWPKGIKTVTLGGDVLLENAPAELFGGLPAPGTLDLGDGVVGASSYGEGGTPTRVGTCRYTASELRANLDGLLGSVGLQAATDQRTFMPLAAAMFSSLNSLCGHVNEARLIQLTNEALGAIAQAITSVDAPVESSPASFPIEYPGDMTLACIQQYGQGAQAQWVDTIPPPSYGVQCFRAGSLLGGLDLDTWCPAEAALHHFSSSAGWYSDNPYRYSSATSTIKPWKTWRCYQN